MRVIEKQMIANIKTNKDFKLNNTQIKKNDNFKYFYLFDNLICILDETNNILSLNNCGYSTKTTKSRLNAILNYYDKGFIYQKDYEWFYQNGENIVEFPTNEWFVIKL